MVSGSHENNDLLSQYRSVLSSRGYKVLVLRENICDAIEGLRATHEKPDIVIIDGRDKKESFAGSIKNINIELPEIKFMIVADDRELENEIKDKGAECVFKKPQSLMAILRKRF